MKESFFSKVRELLADYAQRTVTRINDFPSILDSLQRNLDSLIAKASDVKDQIKLAEQSGKRKRKREVENWLTEVQNIETKLLALENELQSQGFISRFLIGGEAEKLKERVDELVDQSQHFGELVLDVYEIRGEAFSITKMVGKSFEENVVRIWRFLVNDKVSSIGIYGMGGVGKTTLTKHIHYRLIETQECVFWVTVSREFIVTMLQDKIAHVIKLDLSDECNEDKRAARLHEALLSLNEKFVLILDDLWEGISLEKVGDPLRVDGCQLIITTRSLNVCRQMNCQEIIEVETLDTDEAWDLFGEIHGRQTTLNPQVREIAKSMVEMCDGLPLSIITLAGSMRGETVIQAWRDAMEELRKSVMGGNDDMDDKVFKIIKYSIDRLDPILSLCFLCCSLYPQDHKIPRSELIKNFILEELVDGRTSMKSQFEKGHSILDKLVSLRLLESTRVVDECDSVKMHDLVRTVALKITEGKTKVIGGHCVLKEIPNEELWSKDLETISLMHNDINEIPIGVSPNCPNLSTLLLQRNLRLRFIADSFFSQMRSLRTLNLSETDIEVLPDSLSNLERLKALILENCASLVYVPYLGKMKELTQLDLSHTSIKEVPRGMEKLVDLKFLSMKNAYNKLEIFPTGLLPNLEKLQCLHIPYEVVAPIEDIECLQQLEEFEGRVRNVRDFNRFVKSRENRVHSVSYCIEVGNEHLGDEEDDYADSVECMGYTSVVFFKTDFSDEEMIIILPNGIGFVKFYECDSLSNCFSDDFDTPSSLHTLEIKKCGKIECILKNDRHSVALEHVTLADLPDFTGVIHKQNIEASLLGPPRFSSLKSLWISDCNKMQKLGLPASEFPNLETLSIKKCSDIEEIIEDNEEGGGNILTISLPKLKWLELYKLPRLRSICNATMVCDSIHMISLSSCLLLKKVPFYFPRDDDVINDGLIYSPPTTLKGIELGEDEEEWWESLEWEHPSHKNLVQPLVTFESSSEVFY
ncbi:hypothetical protein ACP275_04G154300 [Erythranthe tilingii]